MISRLSLGLVVALGLALAAPAHAQQAAADNVVTAKGFKTRNLVTSLGGFSATVNAPILVTGSQVELEPGGRSGRHQFRVPTYVYVIEGVLTTEYEAGPVGIAGAQYHAAGQSFMDNGGWWHNYFNRTDKPVKVLLLHIGYPGRPDPVLRPDVE
jgi:quercetin dioxygenase-like cupin family protein